MSRKGGTRWKGIFVVVIVIGILITPSNVFISTVWGKTGGNSDCTISSAHSLRIIVKNQHGNPISNFHWDGTRWLHGAIFSWSKEVYALKDPDKEIVPHGSYCLSLDHPIESVEDEYVKVEPIISVEVIDVSTGKEVAKENLFAGQSELIINNLPPGRYIIRAGTTIQADRISKYTEATPYLGPETRRTLRIPVNIGGHDDYGNYRCYKWVLTDYQYHMEIKEYRRYTYYTVSSTVTYIGNNEIEDKAFVLLLTDPEVLGKIAASTGTQLLPGFNLGQSATYNTASKAIGAATKQIFKKRLSPQVMKEGAYNIAASTAIAGMSTLIYIGTDPSYELDETFAAKITSTFIIAIIGAKVGAAVGGPVGIVAGTAVGVFLGVIKDLLLKSYEMGKIRENFATALFDDIYLNIKKRATNVNTVTVTNTGMPIYNVFLGFKQAYGFGPVHVSSICPKINPDSSEDFSDIPEYFCSLEVPSPLLFCDADLFSGIEQNEESQRLKELYWCIHELPSLDFDVSVSSDKYWYSIDENPHIEINVKSELDQGKNVWLDAVLRDQNGNKYCLPTKDFYIPAYEEKTISYDWDIPENVIARDYQIDIHCWKDSSKMEEYNISFTWQKIFSICMFNILSPTTEKPVFVGDPLHPVDFFVKLDTGGVCCPPDVFDIYIGGKEASFQLYNIDLEDSYYFKVTPPIQNNEGSYDLEISMDAGGIPDSAIEQNAVIYSTRGNVDVVEVIDRSGSMSEGKIADAKNAASIFVDKMYIGDYIGVCSFSSGASTNYQLTEITSNTIKQNAKNAIDAISAGGATSIGAGLQAAYNQFISNGNTNHPWAIILMTDGHQNTNPHPNSILPDIKAKNIKVYTIGLGSGADSNLLKHIAQETGGEYYFSPTGEELATIYNAISGKVKSESIVKTIKGESQKGVIDKNFVYIDGTIDVITFTTTWDTGTIDTTLKRPDGTTVNPTDSDVISHVKESNYEIYTIENKFSGKWEMDITTPLSDPHYILTITAQTNVTLTLYTDKDNYNLSEPIHIIAALSHNGTAITHATLNATIIKPDGNPDEITLYDDGNHGDVLANDGVYANYYTNTNIQGNYEIHVYANGTLSPERFTREATKTVGISGVTAGLLSVTPSSWETGMTYAGTYVIEEFNVSSSSSNDETVSLASTDFVNDSKVISSSNMFFVPQTFVVPAGGYKIFYAIMYIPANAESGNYTGNIILTSTANSINIPVKLWVKELKAKLRVSINDSPDPVMPNENLTYVIAISNDGNIPVQNVNIKEYYDPDFVFINSSIKPTKENNTWFIEYIAPGETKEIIIIGKVLKEKGKIHNLIHYYSGNAGWGRIEEYTTILYASPHIELKAPSKAEAGEEILCKLLYYNAGNLDIENVTIRFSFPHMKMVYENVKNEKEWFREKLEGKSAIQRNIWLKVDSPLDNGTILPLLAEFISDEFYLNCTKNITITSSPLLYIEKHDFPDPIYEGENLSYIIVISNNGNMNATNVTILDDYDESLLEIINANGGKDNGDKIIWKANVSAGETISYQIKAKVKDIEKETIIENYVSASCCYHSAEHKEYTKILPILTPSLNISAEYPENAEKNCIIEYKLNITNDGDGDGTTTIIFDYDGELLQILESNGTDDGDKITWTTNIPAGKGLIYKIKAKVKDSLDILCIAKVKWNGNERGVNLITHCSNIPPKTEIVFHGDYQSKTKWGYTYYIIQSSTHLTLRASDTYSGTNHTYYRIWKYDGKWKIVSKWKEYKGEKIKLPEANKKYCIDFYSIDKAGNIERMHWMDIYVKSNKNGIYGIKETPGFEIFFLTVAIGISLIIWRRVN